MTSSSPSTEQGEPTICPWCSARIAPDAARCPSCGAAVRDTVDNEIPGVTQIDVAATSRLSRLAKPGRLATWLGAEQPPDSPDLGGPVEPPSEEVRQEMLRLELAALEAELEARKAAAEANSLLPADDEPAPPAG